MRNIYCLTHPNYTFHGAEVALLVLRHALKRARITKVTMYRYVFIYSAFFLKQPELELRIFVVPCGGPKTKDNQAANYDDFD